MKVSLQEPFSSYTIRKLETDERVKSFDCGDADLNDFILNESGLYRKALLSVSYVFEAPDDINHEHIAAYFSLANDRVSLTDFPNKTEFNRFRKRRFVNEKRLKSYPAAKICRLAVSQELKGKHIGDAYVSEKHANFIINKGHATGEDVKQLITDIRENWFLTPFNTALLIGVILEIIVCTF